MIGWVNSDVQMKKKETTNWIISGPSLQDDGCMSETKAYTGPRKGAWVCLGFQTEAQASQGLLHDAYYHPVRGADVGCPLPGSIVNVSRTSPRRIWRKRSSALSTPPEAPSGLLPSDGDL